MAAKEIRKFDDPVLRKKAKPVRKVTREIRQILDDMLDTMKEAQGVGLAAPQIGVSKRLVVVDVGEGPRFLVNPEIVRTSDETETAWEGCLSFPGLLGEVERYARVTVKALDRDGHEFWMDGDGLLSRALQHEIDHLDGVVFLDRASAVTKVPEEEAGEVVAETLALPAVVFMGSPEFALPSLDELVRAGFPVKLVVTQPPRPKGRKRKLTPTPVEVRARELGIPVITPEKVGSPESVRAIEEASPDLIVVSAYGQKIPGEILALPKMGALNVHASLLPEYRGANPIRRAIMDGRTTTGVTIMWMSEEMDAGDICVQKAVEIGPDETFGTLEKRLASLGAHSLIEAILLIRAGSAPRTPQDASKATKAPLLKPGEEVVNWNRSAIEIHNLVRALSPEPGATTWYRGERIKLWETRVLSREKAAGVPGEILSVDVDQVAVACGEGTLGLVTVQPSGKRPMSAAAFLRGRAGLPSRFGDGHAKGGVK